MSTRREKRITSSRRQAQQSSSLVRASSRRHSQQNCWRIKKMRCDTIIATKRACTAHVAFKFLKLNIQTWSSQLSPTPKNARSMIGNMILNTQYDDQGPGWHHSLIGNHSKIQEGPLERPNGAYWAWVVRTGSPWKPKGQGASRKPNHHEFQNTPQAQVTVLTVLRERTKSKSWRRIRVSGKNYSRMDGDVGSISYQGITTSIRLVASSRLGELEWSPKRSGPWCGTHRERGGAKRDGIAVVWTQSIYK